MNKEFSTTKVTPEGVQKLQECRIAFSTLLDTLKVLCPESREFSLVKTKLEEASFFAIKAISYTNVGSEDSYKEKVA